MICKKCKTENRIKANYCSHCGHPFTDAERNDAYAKTIYGRFEKLEDLWKTVSLDKITGSAIVKVLSLVAVLVFCPVFVNLRSVPAVSALLPPWYYLFGRDGSPAYAWGAAAYGLVTLTAAYVLYPRLRKR